MTSPAKDATTAPSGGSPRFDLRGLVLPGIVLAVAGGVIFQAAHGTTFFYDEWIWILYRSSPSATSLLEPFNNHLMAAPIVIYEGMLRAVGLGSPVPYRLVLLAGHLLTCALLYSYLRRRIATPAALSGTAVLAFFGYAWAVIIWPISLGWVMATAAGIGALLLVDRGTRRSDVGAMVALTVGIASSGIAVPFVIGLTVETATRRSWRRLWVPLVPLALFGAWYVGYASDTRERNSFGEVLSFGEKLVAQTIGTLVGVDDRGIAAHVLFGVVGVALVLLWCRLGRPRSPRLIGNAAALAAFVGILSISRANSGLTEWHSYAAAVFVLLTLGELIARHDLAKVATVAVVVVAMWSVVWNVVQLHDAADVQRTRTEEVRTQLAAIEAGGTALDPDYAPRRFLLEVRIGPYLAAVDAYGSPAYSPAEALAAPAKARHVADATLIAGLALAPRSAFATDAGCATATRDAPVAVEGRAPSVGIVAEGIPAEVAASAYGHRPGPIGRVTAGAPAVVDAPPLERGPSWTIWVRTLDRARVCASGGKVLP